MTVDEFREVLGAMSFTGGLSMWRLSVRIDEFAASTSVVVAVTFLVHVPDRDGRLGPNDAGVMRTATLLVADLAKWDLRRAIEWVRVELGALVTHEVDEGVLVAGVRVFNPHTVEESTGRYDLPPDVREHHEKLMRQLLFDAAERELEKRRTWSNDPAIARLSRLANVDEPDPTGPLLDQQLLRMSRAQLAALFGLFEPPKLAAMRDP